MRASPYCLIFRRLVLLKSIKFLVSKVNQGIGNSNFKYWGKHPVDFLSFFHKNVFLKEKFPTSKILKKSFFFFFFLSYISNNHFPQLQFFS